MRRPKNSLTLRMAAGGVVVCALAVAGTVQPEAAPLATVTPAGASVMWLPEAGTAATVLTVSGPGVVTRQKFAAGASPSLSLSRGEGDVLPDGRYTWELRESFAGINDRVYDPKNGRDQVDPGEAPARVVVEGRVQSGTFTVKSGLVVDADLEEGSAAGRPRKGSN